MKPLRTDDDVTLARAAKAFREAMATPAPHSELEQVRDEVSALKRALRDNEREVAAMKRDLVQRRADALPRVEREIEAKAKAWQRKGLTKPASVVKALEDPDLARRYAEAKYAPEVDLTTTTKSTGALARLETVAREIQAKTPGMSKAASLVAAAEASPADFAQYLAERDGGNGGQ